MGEAPTPPGISCQRGGTSLSYSAAAPSAIAALLCHALSYLIQPRPNGPTGLEAEADVRHKRITITVLLV